MCISDWRAGRFMRSVCKSHSIVSGTPFIVPPSRQRVGIIFSCDATAVTNSSAFEITMDGGVLCVLGPFLFVQRFSLANDGEIPTKQFSIDLPLGGTFVLGVTETFLTEEFLNLGTEQWKQILLGARV